MTTTVTSKGQIVIPAAIRRRHNIKKGVRLIVEEKDDTLVLRPATTESIRRLAGILPTKGRLTRALLEERAKDMEKEV